MTPVPPYPTPIPMPDVPQVLTGAAQVMAWFQGNTTLVVGFLIFAYVMNRVIRAVAGKKSGATTTITAKADGSTTIEVE